jgi:ribokinase
MTRDIDVLAVGGTGLDTVITLDRLPGHDEKVIGAHIGQMPGGPAGNFACAASRLGLRAAVLANVGDDEAGRLLIEDYIRHGVDTTWIAVLPGRRSNFTICLVDPSGEKAVIVVPMLDEAYSLESAQRILPRARLLFGMPNDRLRFEALARAAREHGVEVMIDVERSVVPDPPDMKCFLENVDIASFNRESFIAATGEEPSLFAARRLLRFGPRLVIVTEGAAGALAVTADEEAQSPAFAVAVVDTTGASDTFNAAFVWAMFSGKSLAEALPFANAAAALAVTALGSRGRLPDEGEVRDFLEHQRVSGRS